MRSYATTQKLYQNSFFTVSMGGVVRKMVISPVFLLHNIDPLVSIG